MSQLSLFDLSEDQLIHHATAILEQRLRYRTERQGIDSPGAAKDFVRLRLAQLEHEVFACLFLDNRHRLVAFEELFRGTIDGASVHPREVVKRALHHNAAAVILAHNHPSGLAEPSQADIRITGRLKESLELVDVRILDHLIVGDAVISFSERGLL